MTLIPWDKSCVSSGDSFFLWGIATELLTLARDSNEFLFAWPKTSWLGLRLLYLELLMTHILTNQWKTFSLKPTPLFNVFNIQSRADIGLTFCKQSTCGQPSVATTTHFLHYQLAHPSKKYRCPCPTNLPPLSENQRHFRMEHTLVAKVDAVSDERAPLFAGEWVGDGHDDDDDVFVVCFKCLIIKVFVDNKD